MEFYAHSIQGKPVEEWHRLEEHLIGAANLAKDFAGDGDDWWGCGMIWALRQKGIEYVS